MADVVYSNVRELHRRLDAIDPAIKKAMIKDAKLAAKPLQTGIRSAIPSISPLSGFENSGRLGYGSGKPAKSVTISYRTGRSKRTAITSLLSVKVNSPAVALMDYAGRKPRGPVRNVTRPYAYKGGTRTHRVNGQGEAMIDKLNMMRRASRFAWPAAERALPAVQAQVKGILERASQRISRTF
jgi:hypothetical protein